MSCVRCRTLRSAATLQNVEWLASAWWALASVTSKARLFTAKQARLRRAAPEINSLAQRTNISSEGIKQHANWRAAAAASELRPTYKLKLIKTINYLMLFRLGESELCAGLIPLRTYNNKRQHKMIKFFPFNSILGRDTQHPVGPSAERNWWIIWLFSYTNQY